MTLKMLCAASAAILLAATSAQAAPAKKTATAPATPSAAAAAAPQATPLPEGPHIPGVCIYNREAAIGSSSAGRAAGARMQQLKAQVSAELQAEQQALQTDAQALQAKRTALTQEQLQAQAGPLQQRGEALERKAQVRQRELEATAEKAQQRFDAAITPILRNLYQQHGCSILLRGDVVMGANQDMDLTLQAVQQVNAALPTMTFDREVSPQQ